MPRRLLLLLVLVAVGVGAWLALRGPGPRGGASVPRTLVLVTVDTLRQDRVGAFAAELGEGRTLTPRIDALARAGVRFLDARTPVPMTLPAHVTLFSGCPPAETGVRLNAAERLPGPGARGYPLLAERLKAAGWRTGAFVSAQPLDAQFGLDQGFERYDDGAETLEVGRPGEVPERPGAVTVERALSWLKGLPTDEPTFLWVHLFEPHAPYVTYEADVAAADEIVGRLLDGVRAAGRAEGLAVLLTSDHGEMLGDLGEPTHGYLLADHVLRVPFLLLAPGLAPAVRRDPVTLADVAPTLAALADVDWEAARGPFAGVNLLAGSASADRVRVSESLYAHHSFRWAQLVAATGSEGTLVDRGGARLGWLAPARAGEPQGTLKPADDPPARLGEAIARYRAAERPERVRSGSAENPYGGAGRVEPFLSDAENGRLPDPYANVTLVPILQQIKQVLLVGLRGQATRRGLDQVARELKAVAARDPKNPEIAWLEGLYEMVEAKSAEDPAPHLTRSEQAFGRAFELGRRDPATLRLWVSVNADGREGTALERLRALAPEVGRDCALWLREAEFCKALGRTAEAEAACAEARKLCRSARDRERVTEVCR